MSEHDPINHPSHYTDGKYETIDFIEDRGFGFSLANAVKYISRAGKKEGSSKKEDLEKAYWYINNHCDKHKTYPRNKITTDDYSTDKNLSMYLRNALHAICMLHEVYDADEIEYLRTKIESLIRAEIQADIVGESEVISDEDHSADI